MKRMLLWKPHQIRLEERPVAADLLSQGWYVGSLVTGESVDAGEKGHWVHEKDFEEVQP